MLQTTSTAVKLAVTFGSFLTLCTLIGGKFDCSTSGLSDGWLQLIKQNTRTRDNKNVKSFFILTPSDKTYQYLEPPFLVSM